MPTANTLNLRPEFLAKHMRATAIELSNKQNSGWAQRPDPTDLLEMTYPTADVQRSLDAVSTAAAGRPVVFIGQRGHGKSHIMAVLHHAFDNPDPVQAWAKAWGTKLASAKLQGVVLQKGFFPISETMSNQEYPSLWDLIFDRHPKGAYFKGCFATSGTMLPAKSLLQDMFSQQRTALILDELQTWFDGLQDDPSDHGPKRRQWAFNFIQILSELAKDRPDLLSLIVSVRDSTTEAFRQVHRVGPILIDFKGETAREDRKRLLLHRLFQNRDNFGDAEIEQAVAPYATERVRLLYSDRTAAEQARLRQEVATCWPFAPELLSLLEDNILMAAAAQDNRDLIRVLAEVYRERKDPAAVVTPADFAVDNDDCGVTSLLDAFTASADQEKLREKAIRNLKALRDARVPAPHALAVISSLWMRSLSPGHDAGGTRKEVQLDVTRNAPVDDNGFTLELAEIIDNSFNIHEIGTTEKRYCFRLPENPVSKVKAWARNDHHFVPETAAAPGLLPVGRDQDYVRKALNHMLRPADAASEPPSRPIVLDPNWNTAPWANVQLQTDVPAKWEEGGIPVLIVLPVAPADPSAVLGPWLATHVTVNRNMIRFLLPKAGLPSIYDDRDLLLSARCALVAEEFGKQDSDYASLYRKKFYPELKKKLEERFDRYAALEIWDFQDPTACTFHVEGHGGSGGAIPGAVEKHFRKNHFAPENFTPFIVDAATRGDTVEVVLSLLRGEPLPGQEAMPYFGVTQTYEDIVGVASKDKIALNVGGTWYHREDGEAEDVALVRLRQKTFKTGKELHGIKLGLPSQVGGGGITVVTPPVVAPAATPSGTPPDVPPGIPPVGPPVVPPGPGNTGTGDGGDSSPVVPPVVPPIAPTPSPPVIHKTLGAKSGVNLLGDIEVWGYPDKQNITQASLTINGLSIKDLRDLCTKLPAKIKAELQITVPVDGGQNK